MKRFVLHIILVFFSVVSVKAQEAFTVQNYDIKVNVNQDASVNVTETIDVNFTQPRHGIIRAFLYRYPISELIKGTEKANQQLVSGNKIRLIVKDIKVKGYNYETIIEDDLVKIRIGDENIEVNNHQQYIISYTVLNSINFFENHSELYFNLVGLQWNTTIDKVHFTIELYKPLPGKTECFLATGPMGSTENNTSASWKNNQILSGHTTTILQPNEGLTTGIQFPKDFLKQPDFTYYRFGWLILPILVFFILFNVWKRYGKNEKITIRTEFYPPEKVSPSVSGYIVDGKLDQRDLTALVPYWGAGGYLKINEIEEKSFLGLLKTKEYEFVKLQDLPADTLDFEKTLFNGIFKTGDTVKLTSLKNVLYTTMDQSKKELESKVNREQYYVPYSRGIGALFIFFGIGITGFGLVYFLIDFEINKWPGLAIFLSGLTLLITGFFMPKKSARGMELYAELLGFKEFLKSVETDRLKEFLKQDEHYFDKVLPYAIVFDIADTWKDKLKGLDIPPPSWYSAGYAGAQFNTMNFMNSLDKSMNAMSQNFYSSPSGRSGSGGSFSGGGSSGGGFGGGG
ncbi:MAG: DUF2207 domain-containing protein, partial [Ginsengibacter sp.]